MTNRIKYCIIPVIFAYACGSRSALRDPTRATTPSQIDAARSLDGDISAWDAYDGSRSIVTDVVSPPPPTPRACPYQPVGATIQLQTFGPAQLDGLLYDNVSSTFLVAMITDQAMSLTPSLQRFNEAGAPTSLRTPAFSALPELQISRAWIAHSGAGTLVAGLGWPLAGVPEERSFVELVSAAGRHSRTQVDDPGAMVNSINTPDGRAHVLTVTGLSRQTLRIHTFDPELPVPRSTATITYPNGVGASVAIAPSGHSDLLAVWSDGQADSTVRIHGKPVTAGGQEQILDTINTFMRPTVFAVGNERNAWALWARPGAELWGARFVPAQRQFGLRVFLATNFAISEGAAATHHGTDVVVVASEPSLVRGEPESIRVVMFDEQTGSVTQEVVVDRMLVPLRFAVVSQDARTFTVGWTAVINEARTDPRIFLRTYRTHCP